MPSNEHTLYQEQKTRHYRDTNRPRRIPYRYGNHTSQTYNQPKGWGQLRSPMSRRLPTRLHARKYTNARVPSSTRLLLRQYSIPQALRRPIRNATTTRKRFNESTTKQYQTTNHEGYKLRHVRLLFFFDYPYGKECKLLYEARRSMSPTCQLKLTRQSKQPTRHAR